MSSSGCVHARKKYTDTHTHTFMELDLKHVMRIVERMRVCQDGELVHDVAWKRYDEVGARAVYEASS